jgi:O-antigen ligase
MERSPLEPVSVPWDRTVAAALLAALALPVVSAMVAHGGFYASGQVAFAIVSLSAALAVIAIAGWSADALRAPAVWALVGLAIVAALSALWTIGSAGAALRWAAVIGSLALIAVAAGIVTRRLGAAPVAGVIVILAVAAGLVGLYGAGARVEPLAQRLGGQWSPGGPLEYSPALALVQVAALPALIGAMLRLREGVAAPAAAGAAVAGGILALAGSRVELAIGLTVVAACAITAPRVMGLRATSVLAAAALAATAGGAADAVAGSYVRPYVTGGDVPRLAGLVAIVIGAGGLWLLQRRALVRSEVGTTRARSLAAGLVVVPLAAALLAAALTPDSGPEVEPVSGFTHGRTAQWEAAVDAAVDRPVLGSGALTFLDASAAYQEPPAVRFAHNLPLESWVELGIAGAVLAVTLYAGSAWLVWIRRRSAAAWLLGPAVIAFLVANLFDWPLHLPAADAIFALALGALAAGSVTRPSRIRRSSLGDRQEGRS